MSRGEEGSGVGASQVVLLVKNPPANARVIKDTGLIPRLGRSPRGEPSGIAWGIPWTEEPGGLWLMGSQRVGHN